MLSETSTLAFHQDTKNKVRIVSMSLETSALEFH